MGQGSKQTQQTTQNSTTNPWEKASPLLEGLIGKYSALGTDLTADQQAALKNLTGAAQGIPNFGDQASDAVRKMFGSDTGAQVGMLGDAFAGLQANLGGTASGAELNPYATPGFSDALNTTMNDITDRVKGVYAGSGRNPSGAGSFAGSLGRGLTEGVAPMLQNQFNTNKQNQMAAAGQLFSGAGSTAQGITGQQQVPIQNAQQGIQSIAGASSAYLTPAQQQLAAANTAYQMPYGNLSEMLKSALGLGGMGSQTTGTGTATTSTPGNLFSDILGGVTGAAGIMSMFSDERMKENIEPVGELADGQTVYRYTFKGSPKVQIGLLAQEVSKKKPGAVADMGMGLLGVDYGKATDRAAHMEAA